MKKTFIFAFLAFPSFLTSFFVPHQGLFAVQTINSGSGALNSSAGTDTSLNWAGYAAASGTFTSVHANWTIPQTTNPTNGLSVDATWVGIGGVLSQDLIQAGTQTVFQNGTSTYQAWYELLPSSSVSVPLTIHPGDAMAVSINGQSNSQWQISFDDLTTGQNYPISVSYSSSLSSAEWIEEMPSNQNGFVPLDNFGAVSFSNGFTTQNGSEVSIDGSDASRITMVTSAGQILAVPTSLGTDGSSFTITRSDTAVSTTPTQVRSERWSRTGTGIKSFIPTPREPTNNGRQQTREGGSSFKNFGRNIGIGFQSLRKLGLRGR